MKYAVIATGGKQLKVSIGEEILVDRLAATGKTYNFDKVLLIRDEDDIIVGSPYIADAFVTAKVLGEIKGDKITISKFKAKVHYRRKMGFRPLYSKVKIEAINLPTAPQKDEKAKAVKTA